MTIKNIKGIITTPQLGGLKFILNNVSISGNPENSQMPIFDKKWLRVRTETRGWFADPSTFKLANIKDCMVQSDIWIINMICQDKDNKTDLNSLITCLEKIIKLAKYEQASIHVSSQFITDVPEFIQNNLIDMFTKNNINVFLYAE